MVAHTLDGRAPIDGAPLPHGATAFAGHVRALLALADGSVWSVRRVPSAAAATGAVRVVGATVLIGDSEVASLSVPDARLVALHLDQPSQRRFGGTHGCVSAAGTTTPVHRAVALAVARGEIGRPG
jgi:hypothetical protein